MFGVDVVELATVPDFDSDHGIRWRETIGGAVIADIYTHKVGGNEQVEMRLGSAGNIKLLTGAGGSESGTTIGALSRRFLHGDGSGSFPRMGNGQQEVKIAAVFVDGATGNHVPVTPACASGSVRNFAGSYTVTWQDTYVNWVDLALMSDNTAVGFCRGDASSATQSTIVTLVNVGPGFTANDRSFWLCRIGTL